MIGRRMGFFNKILLFYRFIVIMTSFKDVLRNFDKINLFSVLDLEAYKNDVQEFY
jgi:hypothetical protein